MPCARPSKSSTERPARSDSRAGPVSRRVATDLRPPRRWSSGRVGGTVALRQTEGFKSLLVIPEVLEAEDLALPDCVNDRPLKVHRLRAVTNRAPDVPQGYSVANIDEVADGANPPKRLFGH